MELNRGVAVWAVFIGVVLLVGQWSFRSSRRIHAARAGITRDSFIAAFDDAWVSREAIEAVYDDITRLLSIRPRRWDHFVKDLGLEADDAEELVEARFSKLGLGPSHETIHRQDLKECVLVDEYVRIIARAMAQRDGRNE